MVSFIVNVVLVLLVLGILITIHELGHFLAAKISGVRVDAFAIGFGPKLFSKTVGETTYMLNLLPIGGYVSILGEVVDGDDLTGEDKDDPRNFQNKHPLIRVFILSAGVLFNFLTATVIFYVFLAISGNTFLYPGELDGYIPHFGTVKTEIIEDLSYSEVTEDGGAEESGWPESGYISAVGTDPESLDEIVRSDEFSKFAQSHKGEVGYVEVCSEAFKECDIYDVNISDKGIVGILLSRNYSDYVQYEGAEVLFGGFVHSINTVQMAVEHLGSIFSDASESGDYSTAVNSVSGPVGLYYIVDLLKQLGFLGILDLIANLSLTLFLVNSLPIPALDGGRVALVLIEWVTGKYYSKKLETKLIQVSFVLLMLLMLGIIIKDIVYIDVLRELFA